MSQDPHASVPFPAEEPEPYQGPAQEAPDGGHPLEVPAPAGVNADGVLPSPEDLLLEHDGQIIQLQKDLAQLAGIVGELVKSPPKEKPAPWNWKELDGPKAAQLLTGLREWVDWYNARYGVTADTRIPGCWYRHTPVVEELTAVWTAWQAAYYGHQSPNDAPAYWHERILWPTITRIKKSSWGLGACNPHHKDPRPGKEPSTDTEFAEHIHALKQQANPPEGGGA